MANVIVPPLATVTLPAVEVFRGVVVLVLTVVSARAACGASKARARDAPVSVDRMVVLRRRSINPS